ncbi:MAG: PD-(D/E)XK nuclease family protein [Candidatus Nanoarchaeia archaeon]|nr:PD-(D/E)XK nuclease family protein [Candidatus Nanoarchaeia archaeon]
MTRIESPSSINLYNYCARKYFYRYVKKLPTPPNIHMIRGNVVHSVLENIYNLETKDLDFDNYETVFKSKLQELTVQFWKEKEEVIKEFALTDEEIAKYFEQAVLMALNWFELFKHRLKLYTDKGFEDAFERIKPLREKKYFSEYYRVQGFIDVIESLGDEVRIMDYKTTSNSSMNDAYKLQLAIYSLLYFEEHGKLPNKVGIYFVSYDGVSEILLDVSKDLLDYAKGEIENIKEKTVSNKLEDYPKTEEPNRKCKWNGGKCEYYDICFGQPSLEDYAEFETIDKNTLKEKDLGVY